MAFLTCWSPSDTHQWATIFGKCWSPTTSEVWFSLASGYDTALFSASGVSSSVCYVTALFSQRFHCFIIWLLRNCSVLILDCSIFCLSRNYTISLRFPLFRHLFITSLL